MRLRQSPSSLVIAESMGLSVRAHSSAFVQKVVSSSQSAAMPFLPSPFCQSGVLLGHIGEQGFFVLGAEKE
jgi:hypothetical protein